MTGYKKWVISVAAGFAAITSWADVAMYQLGEPSKIPEFFTGHVSYARSAILSFDDAGTLDYVATPGTYLRSRTTDAHGHELLPGDVVAAKDVTVLKAELEIARTKVRTAETSLAEKKLNHERDQRLLDRGSVSAKAYLDSKTAYENALDDLVRAKAEVVKQTNLIERSILRPPYPCVVEEIYRMPRAGVDTAQPIVKIVFPYAMKITVPLPPGILQHLDQTIRVLVYPVGQSTPVSSWFQRSDIRGQSLECYAYNPEIAILMPGEKANDAQKAGKLFFIFGRMKAIHHTPYLWISPQAIFGTEKEQFVWKVKNLKAFELTRNMPRMLDVEKVAIKPMNRFVDQGMFCMQAFEPSPNLAADDVVVADVPDNFQGGKLFFREKRKLFRDGDVVNVRLIGLPTRGIYRIPREALLVDPVNGALQVLLRKDNKWIPTPVLPAGPIGEVAPVYSDNLPPESLIAADAAEPPGELEPSAENTVEKLPWHPIPQPSVKP